MQERTDLNTSKNLGPVTLRGKHIALEPISPEFSNELLEAGQGFDWAWMSVRLDNLNTVQTWIRTTLEAQERGEEFTFIARDLVSGKIIGSTRYMDTQPKQKGTEIGWTWYSPRVWGTVVNPECKLLLLEHAFEDWGAVRVQLKTDNNNIHSQKAILKLGAKFEGRLRNHRFRSDGSIRDTMMYSITKEEWPEVKLKLIRRIDETEKLR
jgi:N-acetyltransferase